MIARELLSVWCGLLLLAALPASAVADELADEVETNEAVYAVQARPFLKGHEFNVSLGVLPLDSLYKGVTLGFGYAYHFNAVVGWQIVHFRYSFNVDTGTVTDLDKTFGVVASRTPRVQYLLDSSVFLKVLAGKAVLGNGRVAGGEIAVILGPALTVLSTSQRAYGVDVGLGFRAYLSHYFSASLEVRQYELFQTDSFKVDHVFDVSVGASLNLR